MLFRSGIAAASGSTIAFTGQIAVAMTWHAISYTGVDQTGGATTFPETNSDSTTAATPNPLTGADIVSVADNAVLAIAGQGTDTLASWGGTNPLTEQTDQADNATTTTHGSMADRLVTGSETVAVECTWVSQNRSCVASIEIAAFTAAPDVAKALPSFFLCFAAAIALG